MLNAIDYPVKGLSMLQVTRSRAKYGANIFSFRKERPTLEALIRMIKEPMVILLMAIATIYFLTGDIADGIFLSFAVVIISGISLFQDFRSRNALEKLKAFSQPKSRVIREGRAQEISADELVIGDFLIVDEGRTVTADGIIVHANDFSVDESLLTGEALPVSKSSTSADKLIFNGTTVTSGLAIATITHLGNNSRLGQIGKSLESIKEEKTPLERQIGGFVRKMVMAGTMVLIIVWGINYSQSSNVLTSLIKALTLAMSILPEEIPVAFTTFMALGAWRMMKMGVVVKQMKTVETLGSASVMCTDKTGTLTENRMTIAKIYALAAHKFFDIENLSSDPLALEVLTVAMWASEPIPFDPMEVAVHDAYSKSVTKDLRPEFHLAREYPLAGKPPMMTHVFENGETQRIIASKGAPEAFMERCGLRESEKENIRAAISALAGQGYRVLAVATADLQGSNFPALQQQFSFLFKGLVAFYDPPKKNIRTVLDAFYNAGIKVKIITGDNAETTRAIANQIGFRGADEVISGDALMMLSEEKLIDKVNSVGIFTRMFPEAKLRIINALKAGRQVVAMIGDGANDGPALKAAHIGIAMGKKGTEIAKQGASLILLEDDLSKMIEAVAMGRRIYANLKKAIQYIISIHIPIILTVFIPLALGWVYPTIFSPVHIIVLELIMGPTCSMIYENEPMEKNTMLQKPRPFTTTFFNWKELSTSILQGLMISTATLSTYHYAIGHGAGEALTRTMVFSCLISANIWLTLVNRSFFYSLFTVIAYKNKLIPLIIMLTLIFSAALIYWKPLAFFFGFEPLSLGALLISALLGFISVAWYEIIKIKKRIDYSKMQTV